jgi:BirA family biotin operon repressor/biotin-[acetyl-CoA-carboxylase] ligase
LTADGALATSLCSRVGWDTTHLPLIPLLAGVAASRVLPVSLKWPNDLMVGSRKVGGILVEGAGETITVGMGVNLWWQDPPEAMAGLYDEEPGVRVRTEIAEGWAVELLQMLGAGPERWPVGEYREKCQTVGRAISWKPNGSGTALDIERDGGLRVKRNDGAIEVIRSGEVHHVR